MKYSSENTLIVLLGPTAVGKTGVAIRLAEALQTEIISADSRQFYKEMKIGTAPPDAEELKRVRHHFIASHSIKDDYNVSQFEADVMKLLEELFEKYRKVVMVGGSGLYIDAVCKGIDELPDPSPELRKNLTENFEEKGLEYLQEELKRLDPEYYLKVDLMNPKRLLRALEVCMATGKPYSSFRKNTISERPFRIIKIGLNLPREELIRNIDLRIDHMLDEGLLKEARKLYPFKKQNALNTVGYKEFFDYFDGKISLEQAIQNMRTNTRRYAKRQMTWFRKDGAIRWFKPEEFEGILEYVESI